MKKLILAVLITTSITAHAGIAFLKYERVSGMNKICVYNHMGSEVAITIKNYQLCPLNINV